MNASIHVGKIHWELGEHIENLPQLHWVQYNLTFFVDVGTQFAMVMEIFFIKIVYIIYANTLNLDHWINIKMVTKLKLL
jgi:hypothetical protein